MKHAVSLLAVALLLCSCATIGTVQSDPRAELVAAQTTFAATVNQLATMRERGMFTVEQADRMTLVISEGRAYLEEWEAAVMTGEPKPQAAYKFTVVLKALAAYQEEHK